MFQLPNDNANVGGVPISSIADIAAYIREHCAGQRIKQITIAGHMGPGALLGGKTNDPNYEGHILNVNDLRWLEDRADVLLRELERRGTVRCDQLDALLQKIDDIQAIECDRLALFGCQVAHTDDGAEFLQRLADRTGATVGGMTCSVWDPLLGEDFDVSPVPVIGHFQGLWYWIFDGEGIVRERTPDPNAVARLDQQRALLEAAKANCCDAGAAQP